MTASAIPAIVAISIALGASVVESASTAEPSFSPTENFAVGARSLGMAATGTADDSDPSNAFLNPAVLSFASGLAVTSGYARWIDDRHLFDFGISGGAGGTQNRRWHGGGGLRHVRGEARDLDPIVGAKQYDGVAHMTATASIGCALGPLHVGAGYAYRWPTSVAGGDERSEFGVIATTTVESAGGWQAHYGLGASARGTRDAQVRLGLTGGVEDARKRGAQVNIDVDGRTGSVSAGMELLSGVGLAFRIGHGNSGREDSINTFGFGGGRTLDRFAFRVDYAYVKYGVDPGGVHSFGTWFSFSI